MLTATCCLVVGLWLGSEWHLVSGWWVVMHSNLYNFPLSFSLSHAKREVASELYCATREACVYIILKQTWRSAGRAPPTEVAGGRCSVLLAGSFVAEQPAIYDRRRRRPSQRQTRPPALPCSPPPAPLVPRSAAAAGVAVRGSGSR